MGSNNPPLVSFIVPCYNYARYLPDCLTSIFGQEGDFDFEVIAIDDCSTDNTQEVLHRFSDPRLRVITHSVNLGHADTITEGLYEASGTFVARIDPDDRYRPEFLDVTLGIFEKFPEVGLVYGDAALIDDQGEVTLTSCDRVHGDKDFKGNELIPLLKQNFICAPTVVARREAWLSALPLPQGLAFNDWYFTLMIARAYDFYYVDRVLADYRVHASNWHSQIARNKSEEPSIFRLLDLIYGETEQSPELEAQKLGAKRHVYGAQYLTLADKYFGFHLNEDARRCYLQALRYQPKYFFKVDLLRRLVATLVGRQLYDRTRDLVRGLQTQG